MAKSVRQVGNFTREAVNRAPRANWNTCKNLPIRLKRNVCMFFLTLPLLVGVSDLPVNYSMAQTTQMPTSSITIALTGSEVNETKGWVRLDLHSTSAGQTTDHNVNFTVSVASGDVSDVIEAVYEGGSIDANGDLTAHAGTQNLESHQYY